MPVRAEKVPWKEESKRGAAAPGVVAGVHAEGICGYLRIACVTAAVVGACWGSGQYETSKAAWGGTARQGWGEGGLI